MEMSNKVRMILVSPEFEVQGVYLSFLLFFVFLVSSIIFFPMIIGVIAVYVLFSGIRKLLQNTKYNIEIAYAFFIMWPIVISFHLLKLFYILKYPKSKERKMESEGFNFPPLFFAEALSNFYETDQNTGSPEKFFFDENTKIDD